MSKWLLNKFANSINEETAKQFYSKHKDEIENILGPRIISGVGINTSEKVLNKKTYRIWLGLLRTGKDISSDLIDYKDFHAWIIKQHGYGKDDMNLCCISEDKINKKTIFFLPAKLSATIRPANFNKGVHSEGASSIRYYARVNGKMLKGSFDTHERAQHAARKAMVARIHAIMEECKHLISKEAYEAIKTI